MSSFIPNCVFFLYFFLSFFNALFMWHEFQILMLQKYKFCGLKQICNDQKATEITNLGVQITCRKKLIPIWGISLPVPVEIAPPWTRAFAWRWRTAAESHWIISLSTAKVTSQGDTLSSGDAMNSKVKTISGRPGLKLKWVRSEWVCEEKVRMTDTDTDGRWEWIGGGGRICSRQRDEERIRVLDGQTDGERGGVRRVDLGVLAKTRYLNEPIKAPVA